jgi:hypothetical protein
MRRVGVVGGWRGWVSIRRGLRTKRVPGRRTCIAKLHKDRARLDLESICFLFNSELKSVLRRLFLPTLSSQVFVLLLYPPYCCELSESRSGHGAYDKLDAHQISADLATIDISA